MTEANPACRLHWDVRARDIECGNPIQCHPADLTRIPIRPPATPVASTKNPFCGCPDVMEHCWDCRTPGIIETRILRPPLICYKPPCNFAIPAMTCNEPRKQSRERPCDPLCFDWTVDEPGPNDSYGQNGLNWHDWKMDEINKHSFRQDVKGFKPAHPGFTKAPPPPHTPVYIANHPLECYGAIPPCKREPFAMDVDYFRDWRCCTSKPPPPWKPPYAQWATNQHL